jgi:hypothetical protein
MVGLGQLVDSVGWFLLGWLAGRLLVLAIIKLWLFELLASLLGLSCWLHGPVGHLVIG